MARSITGLDFDKMDPKVRAPALVGTYLQYWAVMEIEIDQAITKILGLSGLQEYVFAPNPHISKQSEYTTSTHKDVLSRR